MSAGSSSEMVAIRPFAASSHATRHLRLGVICALILAIYWGPIRHLLVHRWLNDGNWSHGWLIPLFSLYFLATRRESLKQCTIQPSYSGAVVLAGSLAVYVLSVFWGIGYTQALSLVGVIFGITLLLAGWQVMRIAWFPIVFLVLAVPLPVEKYVELTRLPRQFASTVAAAVLPMLIPGLHAQAQAVVIDYVTASGQSGQLNVEEACSGMRLMMAFVTLGVAMAYLHERPWWHRVILLASCVPIAIFCNAIRVVTTGVFVITGRSELAQGTPHQLLGMLMLVVALGLYASISYVLNHLFIEAEEAG